MGLLDPPPNNTIRVLASAGRSGWIYGTGTLYESTVPGNSIKPGSRLSFYLHLVKQSPRSAGSTILVQAVQGANTAILMQGFPTATIGTASILHEIVFSWDRKWAYPHYTVNMGGVASMVAAEPSVMKIVANAAVGSKSPRNKAPIAFCSYTSSPTVETTVIDWSQDVLLRVSMSSAGATDCHELLAFVCTQHVSSLAGLPSKRTIAWGDSLTEGAGSTSENDWLSVFAKTRKGTPVINEGLGGQSSEKIADRAIADFSMPSSRIIWWSGANDATSDQAAWWLAVNTAIQRVIAARGGTTNGVIIANLHIAQNWSAPFVAAAQYVNSQLSATYGEAVADIYSSISPGGVPDAAKYFDNIHLNDTGYAAVAAIFDAKATALGWS